jgi:hypothetical protein
MNFHRSSLIELPYNYDSKNCAKNEQAIRKVLGLYCVNKSGHVYINQGRAKKNFYSDEEYYTFLPQKREKRPLPLSRHCHRIVTKCGYARLSLTKHYKRKNQNYIWREGVGVEPTQGF